MKFLNFLLNNFIDNVHYNVECWFENVYYVVAKPVSNRFKFAFFCRQCRMNCRGNARALGKLKVAVDTCKRVLSTMNVAQCSIDSLHEGMDFNASLSRLAFSVHSVESSFWVMMSQLMPENSKENSCLEPRIQVMQCIMRGLVWPSAGECHLPKRVLLLWRHMEWIYCRLHAYYVTTNSIHIEL